MAMKRGHLDSRVRDLQNWKSLSLSIDQRASTIALPYCPCFV